MKRRDITASVDWISIVLFIGLLSIGWLMLYAVSYTDGNSIKLFDFSTLIGKQTVWLIISAFVFAGVLIVDKNIWRSFAYLIYGLAIFLLLAVLIFGTEIKGAKSWFVIGSFLSFQPSELAKLATCLALSSHLSNYATDLKDRNARLLAFGIFLLPAMLVALQPDAGSALVFCSFLIVLFRGGLSVQFFILLISSFALLIFGLLYSPIYNATVLFLIGTLLLLYNYFQNVLWYGVLLVIVLITIVGFYNGLIKEAFYTNTFLFGGAIILQFLKKNFRQIILVGVICILGNILALSANYSFNNFLEPHQQERINVWLQPEKCDPQGSLYNILQSKMAIGSGGVQGKGFLQGTMTKLNYVPEQSTDFIFCTIGEEQGFLGSIALVLLYFLLILRIITIGDKQRLEFSRYYAYGFAGVLFFHMFINIGMTMGLVPVIGIPLPFVSYGGSSLLIFTIMMGIFIKISE